MHQKYIQYFFFFWFIYTLNLPTFCTLLYSLCTSAKSVCYFPFIYRFSHEITSLFPPSLTSKLNHPTNPSLGILARWWTTGSAPTFASLLPLSWDETVCSGDMYESSLFPSSVWRWDAELSRIQQAPLGLIYINTPCSSIYVFWFCPSSTLDHFCSSFAFLTPLWLHPSWDRTTQLSVGENQIIFPNVNNASPFQACSSEQRLQHKSFLGLGWQFSSPEGLEKWE